MPATLTAHVSNDQKNYGVFPDRLCGEHDAKAGGVPANRRICRTTMHGRASDCMDCRRPLLRHKKPAIADGSMLCEQRGSEAEKQIDECTHRREDGRR